jgi:tetratricopeptide (TPR) repeat protein
MRPLHAACLLAALALAGCQNPVGELISYGNQYREEGIKEYRAGDYTTAAGAFDEAVAQNAADARNHYWQGEAYLKLGRDQQAVQALRTAMRVRQLSSTGREDLALRDNIAAALGEAAARDRTDRELNRLLADAQGTGNADVYLALAEAHRARGDADNAVDAYEQARMAAGPDVNLAKRSGLYLVELGQPDLAEPILVQAYQLDPNDAQINAALRQVGVIPGPSLRSRDSLASPILPKGPLPEFKVRAGFEDNRDKPVDLDEVRARLAEEQAE